MTPAVPQTQNTKCWAPFGTFTGQLGVNLSGKFFGVSLTGTFGLAVDGYGHVALYSEGGGGVSTSPDAAAGFVLHGSNGNSVRDLNGVFSNVNAGGGWGPHAIGDGFFGYGENNQRVEGGGITLGAGAGAVSSVSMTDTKVFKPLNNPNAGC